MGTLAYMIGEPHVPEEKREELSERMLELFRRGGLFEITEFKMSNMIVYLLEEPYFYDDGRVYCDYSIFEQQEWSESGYNEEGRVFSDKIGCYEFMKTISAAYFLWEMYSDKPCVSGVDWLSGSMVKPSIAWLNYLFDEDYTVPNRDDYTKIYIMDNGDCIDNFTADKINTTHGLTESFGMDVIQNGTEKMITDLKQLSSINRDLVLLRDALEASRDAVRNILKKSPDISIQELCAAISEEIQNRKFTCFDTIPKSAVAQIIAEEYKQNVFDIYYSVVDNLTYTNASERDAHTPVGKLTTTEYMGVGIDDMLYYIDNLEGISFDLKTDILEFQANYEESLKDADPQVNPHKFTEKLVTALSNAYDKFGHVHMFKTTFDEMIENCNDPHYQAALDTFITEAEIAEMSMSGCSRREDMYIKDVEHPRYQARLKLNRLLAILANKKIRMQVFGF